MMRSKSAWLIVMAIILSMYLAATYTQPVQAAGKGAEKMLIIYAPFFNPHDAVSYGGNATKKLFNNTYYVRVRPRPPYTPLYYELLSINGSWRLDEGIPLANASILLPNGSYTDAWRLVNQTVLKKIWGDTVTVFIGAACIDPEAYGRAANFYYNTSNKRIPPAVFNIPLNGEAGWGFLGANISVRETNITGVYSLRVSGYLDVRFSKNQKILGPYLLNVPEGNPAGLSPGRYRITFIVLSMDNETVKLFTPGTIMEDSYASNTLSGYSGTVTPHLPLEVLNEIGVEGLNASIGVVAGFYASYLSHVLDKYKAGTIYYLDYPVLRETYIALRMLGAGNETSSKILGRVYDNIASLINTTRRELGEDTQVIIYSPYSQLDNAAATLTLPGEEVAPGAYRGGDIGSVLEADNIPYTLLFFGPDKIYLVDEPGVSINGSSPIGPGYLVALTQGAPGAEDTVVDTYEAAGYIAGQSRLFGIGRENLAKTISDLRSQITELNNKINDLKSQQSILNNTVEKLRTRIGELEAKLTRNCSDQLNQLQAKLDEEKKKSEQAMLYATAGAASTIIIALVFSLIAVRLAKKTAAAPTRGRRGR